MEDLKVGGLERALASLVLSLDPAKYDVQVWCLAGGGAIAGELVDRGIALRILGLDVNGLREKINFYLRHPEARKTIAAMGQQEVVTNHTYIHRIKELLTTIGLNV